jgi:hypothetical protein
MPPLPYPALALHAKVAKFGCTRSLRGDGVAVFSNFFLPETEAEILEIWNDPVERKTDTQKIIW